MALPRFKHDMDSSEAEALLRQARKASEMLKALSHETRLLILCILQEGEKSVSDLEEILSMPQAVVSQQLARLRIDGLVSARREGRMIYYRIVDAEMSTIIGTLYDLFCAPVREDEKTAAE
jgi:DNA-binding transcriptional ArsR family regulator